MRLTTKGRYAVTAMLDLALNANANPVSLADISQRQNISLSYLEQLFAKLRRAKLVASVRGPGGGALLSGSAEQLLRARIVDAMHRGVAATGCAGQADSQDGETWLTQPLWCDLSVQIHHFLSGISLASLV